MNIFFRAIVSMIVSIASVVAIALLLSKFPSIEPWLRGYISGVSLLPAYAICFWGLKEINEQRN